MPPSRKTFECRLSLERKNAFRGAKGDIRRPKRPASTALLILVVLSAACTARFEAIASAAEQDSDQARIERVIGQLSDDDFLVREQAAEVLRQWAQQPNRQESLAREVRRALDASDVDYESRRQLERLARRLPPAKASHPSKLADDDLDRLLAKLDGDTYADRVGAAAHLASAVETPSIACRVIERLRPLRRSATLSRQTRERIEPIWKSAQLVWLTSDPKTWQWSDVSQEHIDEWLDMLTRPLPPPVEKASLEETRARLERKRRVAGREIAHEQLLALLARDDQTARVKAAVDERLAGGRLDADANKLLGELTDWARPWVVMEGWTEGKVRSLIELPVGVPHQTPMAPRPTLFDKVDARQAHCASDAALRPGNYPLGVLFPHPSPIQSESQFIILSLPTPRARLAYHYQIEQQRDARLPKLSERTLARLAAEKRPLNQAEFIMLTSLDAHAVSRFAGRYLTEMGDPTPPDKQREEKAGRGSPHSSLCNMLVEIGTHEAVPGILQAIRAGKLPKPSGPSSPNWPWIAVLTILASDPGPDADRILPDLVSRTDSLVSGEKIHSDVGATAAAILVELHGVPLEKFGLELVEDALLAEYGGIGYRFNPPEMRQRVLEWWKGEQASKEPTR